jgi:stage II sporulation protein D
MRKTSFAYKGIFRRRKNISRSGNRWNRKCWPIGLAVGLIFLEISFPRQVQADPLVRVLLMDSGYGSYYHENVSLTSQAEGIAVSSISRAQGIPVYQGSIEVEQTPQGYLLINELPLEEYLEGVVPGEMPASYEMEALKAQAICARTYACRQIQKGTLEDYGADLDDSVNYQVYENQQRNEAASRAVQETAGRVLCKDGELIEAYYFSTSAGKTSTDEIWGVQEVASYLKSVDCSFDSGEPWSRWQVDIPWDVINGKAQQMEGYAGTIKGLEITTKSQSGATTCLTLYTEDKSIAIEGEYQIRQFLSPQGLTITKADGETVTGGALLPSAYISIEVYPGQSVQITGGGYGHGVGMSQTAANRMAQEGYSCEEILDYFFDQVEIQNVQAFLS